MNLTMLSDLESVRRVLEIISSLRRGPAATGGEVGGNILHV